MRRRPFRAGNRKVDGLSLAHWGELPNPASGRRFSATTVWYGIWSGGGKIGKVDVRTGKIVEYNIPMPDAKPTTHGPMPRTMSGFPTMDREER